MLEVGWSEMLVIAVIMIVVVGPKDLPGMLRSIGRTTAKLRAMAGDFQKQFNDALQEAELGDLKKSVDDIRGLNPKEQIRKHLNPFEKAAADVRAGLDGLNKQPPKTADPQAHPAEPLKAGPVVDPELPAASAALAATPPAVAPIPAAAPAKAKVAAAKPKTAPKEVKVPAKPKAAAKKPAKPAKTST